MVAHKAVGFVDRRKSHRDVGRRRRFGETDRLVAPEVIVKTLDWLHRFRLIPWFMMALLIPPQVWPASWWLDVRSVIVSDVRVGEQTVLVAERKVKRAFRGAWNATIMQWDGYGWVTFCNAYGSGNYRTEARFPVPLTLKWWTDAQCHELPAGRYKMHTTWRVLDLPLMPDKIVEVDSNVWEVRS